MTTNQPYGPPPGGQPVPAYISPQQTWEPPKKKSWPRRHPFWTVVIALIVGIVIGGIAGSGGSKAGSTATPAATVVLHPADVIARLRTQGEFTVTQIKPGQPTPLFAQEASTAVIADTFGNKVGANSEIVTFGNATGRASWLDMIHSFGRAGVVGVGNRPEDLWGVNPAVEQGGLDLADKIAQRLHGTIR